MWCGESECSGSCAKATGILSWYHRRGDTEDMEEEEGVAAGDKLRIDHNDSAVPFTTSRRPL